LPLIIQPPARPDYVATFVLEADGSFGDMDEYFHMFETFPFSDANEAEALYHAVRLQREHGFDDHRQLNACEGVDPELSDLIPIDGRGILPNSIDTLRLRYYDTNGIIHEVEVTDA
jgi:hypothetical protein